MTVEIARVPLAEILPLRELYRREMNCQIVHDSWHRRGFTDSYLIRVGGRVAGYGSVGGVGDEPREVIKEFYLLPSRRPAARRLFREFAAVSRARRIEAQTNDRLLTLMLLDCVETVERDRVLFDDAFTTSLSAPGVDFRRLTEADLSRLFLHRVEPHGDWGLDLEGEIVATGGLTFHYNIPFADIYMEVGEPWRRRGHGAFLVQELKRVCYEMGRVPAARCQASNAASRATLEKAGMLPCARILAGRLAPDADAPGDGAGSSG